MAQDFTLTGGCLCGAVRYAYEGPLGGDLGAISVCHCSQCLRAQGNAVAVAPAAAAGFTLTAGADRLREFQSTPGKYRAFCGECGSPIYSRREDAPDRLRLRLGALDAAPATLVVDCHKFTEGAPAWSLPGDAPWIPGQEPGVR